ncbi:MAG TPA: winged helix DNA-binding domain-containing protein [Ktedonosporobacter sp.]|nr:winged helix DNA-binding domain-containing protein [Ktedonosporobacter sp.]
MTERILTLRELNRATLARQLLLERSALAPLNAVKQIAGLQGQLPNPPYIGLWSRLHAFQRTDLTCLLEQRQVVRTSMMRRTLHLTTTEDYMCFRPALYSLHTSNLDTYFSKQQGNGLDKDRLLAEIQAYLQEKPRTNVELRAKIAEMIPDMGERLLYMVRAYLSLIQVFPGGAWGVGGSPAYAEATRWLGRSFVSPSEGLRYLILSYLAAFGPASVKDIQAWSGLSRLSTAVDALRPELTIFRDEQGRELFDLPGAPLPEADRPAPVRFIPDFDNLVLAYNDRKRIIADRYRPYVFPGYSSVLPTFLVDGFVRGVWEIKRTQTGATLVIQPFEPLADQVQRELREEGERLLCFAGDSEIPWEIEFIEYGTRASGQNLWGRL